VAIYLAAFMEIWHLKDNGVTTFTWPFDSRWATSYGWTMHLSGTVMKIWHLS